LKNQQIFAYVSIFRQNLTLFQISNTRNKKGIWLLINPSFYRKGRYLKKHLQRIFSWTLLCLIFFIVVSTKLKCWN